MRVHDLTPGQEPARILGRLARDEPHLAALIGLEDLTHHRPVMFPHLLGLRPGADGAQ